MATISETETAAGKSREELTELLSAVCKGKQIIEDAVSELDRQKDIFEEHSQRTITEIDTLLDQLENSLKTRGRRVKEEELEAKSEEQLIPGMGRLNISSQLPPHTEPVEEMQIRKWRFDLKPKCGQYINLTEDGITAWRGQGNKHGIVVSAQEMMVNELFEVEILSEKCKFTADFPCGAVQYTDGFTVPSSAHDGWDCAAVFSNHNFICRQKMPDTDKRQLHSLPKGTRVGVMLDSDRYLHLFIDGQKRDVIHQELSSPCFAFFELLGYYKGIKALPLSYK